MLCCPKPHTQYFRWGRTSAEESRTTASLNWWQCHAWGTSGYCWPFWLLGHAAGSRSTCHQSEPPDPFCMYTQDCPIPGAESSTCSCRASFNWWLPNTLAWDFWTPKAFVFLPANQNNNKNNSSSTMTSWSSWLFLFTAKSKWKAHKEQGGQMQQVRSQP